MIVKMMGRYRRRGRLVILAYLLALLGLGAIAAWFFSPHLTLRVAAGPMGSDGQRFLAAFVQTLADAYPRVRLKVVPTADVAASAKALDAGDVDLAVVRSDMLANTTGQTIAILRRDVVGFIVPPRSPIEDVRALAGKAIGIVKGPPEDEHILDQILTHYQIPVKTIPRVGLALSEIGPAIRQKRVAAVFALGPAGHGRLAEAVTEVAQAGKGAPDILDIEAAEAIAQRLPILEVTEIAPGAFGGTPLRPEESVTTLAVTMRLLARPSMPNYVAGEVARLLFTTKSRLVATLPQVGQIEAPDTETDKGPTLLIHPGAAAYLRGVQPNLWEVLETVFYPGLIVMSLLGSAGAWL